MNLTEYNAASREASFEITPRICATYRWPSVHNALQKLPITHPDGGDNPIPTTQVATVDMREQGAKPAYDRGGCCTTRSSPAAK